MFETKKRLSKKILTVGMIAKTVKVSQKGQIAIPFDIREAIGLSKGDDLLVIQRGNKIVLEKADDALKDSFRDLLKHSEQIAKKLWDNKFEEVWNNV